MNLQHHLEQLRSLDDEALLRSLKRHVGSECRLNALVLAHLAEVDARGAYRQWACDTLTAYCVYELRLSEDEAQRRCRAARVARQFPMLFEMLAEASIHLTGILLLAPHLTAENHRDLLARARYRRKREIERLLAEVAPAPDVPARIEPLGPALGERPRASNTWAALVESHAGYVRHLERGDSRTQAPSAPDDWHEALIASLEPIASDALTHDAAAAPARSTADELDSATAATLDARGSTMAHDAAPAVPPRLARCATRFSSRPIRPTSTCSSARAICFGTSSRAVTSRSSSGSRCRRWSRSSRAANAERRRARRKEQPLATSPCSRTRPRRRSREALSPTSQPSRSRRPNSSTRSRPCARPLAQQRSKRRCRATRALEFHHEQPFARGGPPCMDNISLRCRAHNELAAEHDFGRELVRAPKHRCNTTRA